MTMPAAGQDFYGKTAGEMITGAAVDVNGNVTGTFQYVTGYTGFNSEETEEQEGYFFPFHLTKTGTTMSFLKNGEPGKEKGKREMAARKGARRPDGRGAH